MNVGKVTTQISGESLAKSMECEFVMSVNMLSTYQKRDKDSFFKLLRDYDINPNSYWIDKDHINELIEKVYYLINNNYIKKQKKYINSMNIEKTIAL